MSELFDDFWAHLNDAVYHSDGPARARAGKSIKLLLQENKVKLESFVRDPTQAQVSASAKSEPTNEEVIIKTLKSMRREKMDPIMLREMSVATRDRGGRSLPMQVVKDTIMSMIEDGAFIKITPQELNFIITFDEEKI